MKIEYYIQGAQSCQLYSSFYENIKTQSELEKKFAQSVIEPGSPLIGTSSIMFNESNFYNPLYGYCKCTKVRDEYYIKKQSIVRYVVCGCLIDISEKVDALNERLEAYWRSWEDANIPANGFPLGFRKFLSVEPFLQNDIPGFCVFFVNVLNVYQLSHDVYDVGIGCIYFSELENFNESGYHFAPIARELLGENYFRKLTKEIHLLDLDTQWALWNSHRLYMREHAYKFIQENKEFFDLKCSSFIKEWHKEGILPKEEYFFHALSTYSDKEVSMKHPYIPRDRFYLNVKEKLPKE